MRIFFPIGSFYPAQIGGPDNIMYWHAKALHQRGHEVWVATTNDGINSETPLNRWLETDYGRVFYAKTAIHYAPLRLLLASLRPLFRCEIIHLSAIFYPISWLLAPLAVLLGKKIVWTSHGEFDPEALIYSNSRKEKVLKWVRLFHKKVLFHATCDAETLYTKKQMGDDTPIIQVPYFMELPEKCIRHPENYFLYVGRIHPKKAIERLIEAVAIAKYPKPVKIIGDYNNEYGQELIQLATGLGVSKQVEFLGHKRGIEKYQLMANAYCMVMPSHTENFGIVVTEALTQGTPVIASLGTPWAVLTERKAGIWSSNEAKALANALDQMALLSDADYEKYRCNAEKLVHEDFDIAPNISRWEAIYRSLR